MGTYAARPDGLFSLDYGDGTPPIPLGLSESQLQAAGHQPAVGGGPVPGMGGAPLPDTATAFRADQPVNPEFRMVPDAPLPTPGVEQLSPEAAAEAARHAGGMGKPISAPDLERVSAPGMGKQLIADRKKLDEDYRKGRVLESDYKSKSESLDSQGTIGTKSEKPIAAEELVSYQPQSGGKGGASEAPVTPPARAGGGGGGAKIPKDQVLPGLKREIEGDERPERQLEGAFERFYGEEDARLAREEQIAKRQKDVEAAQLQRAAVDEDIRRKHALIDQREKEAEGLKPKSASEIWKDRGVAAQIGAAIMIGIGGYAQGLVAARGGHLGNAALDGINAGINQEIQDQRLRYEDALAKGKRAENDYEKAIAIYGTPEAAALDLKIRSYALADAITQSKQQAIGSQESLNNAIQLNQSMRIEREKAKQELYELERIKALRAAQAAGAGGQSEALARQGIVKIGKDFYTVDKKTGQWVPLDKAAELAGKARGGPTAQKADSVVATIDVLGNRLAKKPKNGEVFAPENQNIVTRGVRSAVNAVAGERTVLPGTAKQRDEANEFDQIKNDLMAQTSVINGQGAMSDPEAKRATDAIGQARTWGELQRSQRYLREKAAAAASAYDGGEEQPAR